MWNATAIIIILNILRNKEVRRLLEFAEVGRGLLKTHNRKDRDAPPYCSIGPDSLVFSSSFVPFS